ncbi:hypothetical protein C0J52_11384 [Blattella germanica]|nr:hypothetical protein C0J52_11384 [Blattella germanica]
MEATNLTPQPKRQKCNWTRMSWHPQHVSSNVKNLLDGSHTDNSDDELHSASGPSSSSQDSVEQAEECEQGTPAPPPSPEHNNYLGSPYPTPCNYRRQVSSSLVGILEEERYPHQQSTPKTPHQKLALYPRFSVIEKFGGWRESHAISYASDSNSKLDDDFMENISNLSVSQEVNTRELLIAKMKEHEEKTQKLLCTKKQISNDSDVVLNEEENDEKLTEQSSRYEATDNEESKPSRFSRLISERSTTSPGLFLGDLERRYGKEKLIELAETQEISEQSRQIASENNVNLLHSLDKNDRSPRRVEDEVRVLGIKNELKVSECVERISEDVVMLSSVEKEDKVTDVENEVCISDDDVEIVSVSEEIEGVSIIHDQITSVIDERISDVDGDTYEETHRPSSSEFDTNEETHRPTSTEFVKVDVDGTSNIDERISDVDEDTYEETHRPTSPEFETYEEIHRPVSTEFDKVNNGGASDIDVRVSDLDADTYEEACRPTSPEFDIEVPHAIVAGNYSLISEPEEQKSIASIRADEDGGYLSVLSEAAMYHALLKSGSVTFRGINKNQDLISNTSDKVVYQEESKPTTVSQPDIVTSTTRFSSETSLDEEMQINDDSVVTICSTHVSTMTRTHERELDATSDLNESDVKKLEQMRSFESSEGGFHDTMEEIEMMMKLGMDYFNVGQNKEDANTNASEEIRLEIPEFGKHLEKESAQELEDEVILDLPVKSNIPKLQSPATRLQTNVQATKLQAIVSPTVHAKPITSPFKVPVKPPVHMKKTPLKPVTPPCKKPYNYNKIISPVIKEAQDIGEENINLSNLQPVLPMEEPPKERMPRVAEKMKKLVDTPRPRVIKHEGRVRISPSPKARLNLDNSTSDAEISVVVGKQVSRTNTLAKNEKISVLNLHRR